MIYYKTITGSEPGAFHFDLAPHGAVAAESPPLALEDIYHWIPPLLVGFRLGAHLDQADFVARLADCLGKRGCQSYVSKIECGKKKTSWGRLAAWMAVLGLLPHHVVAAAEALARARMGFDRALAEAAAANLYQPLRSQILVSGLFVFSVTDRTWEEFAASIGPAVRVLRGWRDMTQEQLAAGISNHLRRAVKQGQVSGIEGGRKNASWGMLTATAFALRCTLSEVLRTAEIHATTYDLKDTRLLKGVAVLLSERLEDDGPNLDPETRNTLEKLRAELDARQKKVSKPKGR